MSPGLPCPGAIYDCMQGKWMAILLNPVESHLAMLVLCFHCSRWSPVPFVAGRLGAGNSDQNLQDRQRGLGGREVSRRGL